MTRSQFIKRCVALLEVSKHSVGDLANLTQRVLGALDQPHSTASTLRGPLESLHDLIESLRRN